MSAQRALITGATGMIGAALAERLLAGGWSVSVLTRANSALTRLAPHRERISVHVVDWSAPNSLNAAVAESAPTTVFHLAGPPFNPPTLPLAVFIDAAVDNTAELLRALDDAGNSAGIVFAGSAAVCGNPSQARESEAPAPATWLGAGKAMAAVALAAAGRKTGSTGCRTVSIATPYGPAERGRATHPERDPWRSPIGRSN